MLQDAQRMEKRVNRFSKSSHGRCLAVQISAVEKCDLCDRLRMDGRMILAFAQEYCSVAGRFLRREGKIVLEQDLPTLDSC